MIASTQPAREPTHDVLIHKEHDRTEQRRVHLCLDHYIMAQDCKMIDVDYGPRIGVCFFCAE